MYVCPYVYDSPNIQFLSLARPLGFKLIAGDKQALRKFAMEPVQNAGL